MIIMFLIYKYTDISVGLVIIQDIADEIHYKKNKHHKKNDSSYLTSA
ncbi:MAG: hypothetical protein ILA15_00515 [Clostridiales bacterium]|nr:hypothetical protein [Clostridiales bacterium]